MPTEWILKQRTTPSAQKLNRQWIGIGIDITHLSTSLMKLRLRDNFGLVPVGKKNPSPGTQAPSPASVRKDADDYDHASNSTLESVTNIAPDEPALQARAPALQSYQVIGEPEDPDGARELAKAFTLPSRTQDAAVRARRSQKTANNKLSRDFSHSASAPNSKTANVSPY